MHLKKPSQLLHLQLIPLPHLPHLRQPINKHPY